MTDDKWLVIGQFGKPHGIKGEITVISFTEHKEDIFKYVNWHVQNKTQCEPIKISYNKLYNHTLIVRPEDYSDREMVANLTNKRIVILQQQLPTLPINDYYWHELIGLTAVNTYGENLGIVTELLPTGSNDVLVIQGTKRHLVPYFPGESVIKVDLASKRIIINWE